MSIGLMIGAYLVIGFLIAALVARFGERSLEPLEAGVIVPFWPIALVGITLIFLGGLATLLADLGGGKGR